MVAPAENLTRLIESVQLVPTGVGAEILFFRIIVDPNYCWLLSIIVVSIVFFSLDE